MKKWYSYFISVDQPAEGGAEEAGAASAAASQEAPRAGAPAGRTAAQTVAEIAATVAEPKFKGPVSNPTSFEEIYAAAEIRPPSHGYTILKVAEMLQSGHIRALPPEVRKSSILVALEAAGVKLAEVLQDAVRRDKALDTYESVQQKAREALEARKTQENRQIQAELDRVTAEYNSRIRANDDEVAKEKERFNAWRLKKQQEEERIAEAVSFFTFDKIISTRASAAPPQTPKAQGS